MYDNYSKKYLSIAVDPTGKKKEREVLQLAEDHKAIIVPHERDL